MMQATTMPVDRLILDPQNPRLPEDVQHQPQSVRLTYLFENAVLDELARSMLENGFFPHEPLVVLPEDGQGRHVVVEGNRRLATLMIIHQLPPASEADLSFDLEEPPDTATLAHLAEVPCFTVGSRDEVRRFLGFRHIGGIKTWSPEAKARYLVQEVKEAVRSGVDHPFLEVARQVGSNTQGVRNPYIALRILQFARDEFGADVRYIQHQRFGVWNRAMNSSDLRRYIGFPPVSTYDEIEAQLQTLNRERLTEVFEDLRPERDDGKAVLADSRDVTAYAAVLADKDAHAALRRYNDLSLARQIVEKAALPTRVRRMADSCQLILQEIQRADVTEDLAEASEALFGAARTLRDATRARVHEDD